MKFIHLSNVRLGESAPEGFPIPVDRAAEIREDFLNVLKLCEEQQIDALFITGNLFSHVPSEEELHELDERFSELTVTRVFILTGRLDAPKIPTEASAYKWKSNTILFAGESVDRVYATKLDCEITGVGYSPRTWDKVQIQRLERGSRARLQILLLPFAADEESDRDLSRLSFDFDYIGLGQKVLYKTTTRYPVYAPGMFEPNGTSQQLHHGFFLCTLTPSEDGQVSLTRQFVQGARREYMSLKVNCTKDLPIEKVTEEIRSAIKRYGTQNFYTITLEGALSYSVFAGKGKLYTLGNVLSVRDETDEAGLIETLQSGNGSSAVSRFIAELMKQENSEIRENALRAGLEALIGAEEAKEGEDA